MRAARRRRAVLLGLLAVEEPLGHLGELLRGRVRAVQDGIRAHFEEVLLDVLHREHLRGVDDAHVHAGHDGRVVQEDGVDGLADLVDAAEAEAQIGHAAGDLAPGADLLDLAHRGDEVDAVGVVLLDARADGQDDVNSKIVFDIFWQHMCVRGQCEVIVNHLETS